MNDEYFEETSRLIAEQIKKGGTKMEGFKSNRKEALLWLKHNQKQILAYVSLILLALDYMFGITERFGLTHDAVYIAAAVLFLLVMWVVGGEGFTGNVVNRAKELAKSARKETSKKGSLYQKELKRIDLKINELMKYQIGDVLPPDKKKEYDSLVASKEFYQNKVEEFLDVEKKEKEAL